MKNDLKLKFFAQNEQLDERIFMSKNSQEPTDFTQFTMPLKTLETRGRKVPRTK